MDLIDNFIHWKKNIKRVPLTGYSFIINSETLNIHDVKEQIENICSKIGSPKINEVLLNNKLKYHSNETFIEYYFHIAKLNEALLGKMIDIRISERIDITRGKILSGKFIFDSQIDDFELFLLRLDIKLIIKLNPHYTAWENMNAPTHYKYKYGLKVFFSEMFQTKMVDISDRPGRSQWKSGFFFQGGSDYWFGKSFFQYIPKSELISFKDCIVNEELENEVIHIKLFELMDYWKDENQLRLASLRKLLKVDEQ